jgi:uncharacterized protein YggE
MKRFLLFSLVIFPISLLAEGGLPDKPYIYVQGRAEIEKPADIVTLHFGVMAQSADEAKANQEVQAKATKILTLCNSSKIAEKDVVAEDLTSEAQYEKEDADSDKRGKLVGFKVSRPFMVKVRDVSSFAKLVDEILALGGVEFSGIDGGLSNQKELQDQMWEKALTDSRQRADKTLKGAGMKIDSVFAISPISVLDIQHEMFFAGSYAAEMAPPAKMANPSQYRLQSITVGESVHVIYLISPAK